MEKIGSILLGLGILYVLYTLAIKGWDYTSQVKRDEEKARLKQAGLSTRFYFISTGRLSLFNLLSCGLFALYWAYKQWQAVQSGYKSTRGNKLRFGPILRTVFIFFSFYQLTAIINRTCLYMHKKPALPPVFWGTVLWGGLAAACCPVLPAPVRILGGVFFIFAPTMLQRRINALPKELPPTHVKVPEIIWLVLCWLFLAAAWRVLTYQGIL